MTGRGLQQKAESSGEVTKSDWAEAVDGYFKPSEERRAIRDCMPEDIRPDIERM